MATPIIIPEDGLPLQNVKLRNWFNIVWETANTHRLICDFDVRMHRVLVVRFRFDTNN